MLQPVDGAFRATHSLGDLRRGEPDDVAHDHHLALLVGQRVERGVEVAGVVARVLVVAVAVGVEDLFGRGRPPAAQVVQRDVASKPQQPARERHTLILVLEDHRHQLQEHVLREVFGFLVVPHDAADIAVDVVRVADVEQPDRVAISLLGARDRQAHFTHRVWRLV